MNTRALSAPKFHPVAIGNKHYNNAVTLDIDEEPDNHLDDVIKLDFEIVKKVVNKNKKVTKVVYNLISIDDTSFPILK